jgi:UDP-3-O-[3-hydroxymyristoyl] glucosamine N-acyltransferase
MFPRPMTLRELAETLGGVVEGDASTEVLALASLDEAGENDLTFAVDETYAAKLDACNAKAAIVPTELSFDVDRPVLRVESVPMAIGLLLGMLAGEEDLPPVGVHPSAVLADDATVSPKAAIGPHVTIGAGATLADGVVLCAGAHVGAGVTIAEGSLLAEGAVVRQGCVLGKNVRVGPNSVIGYDGFGYQYANGVHHKIPHAGNVVIEDDVELGANVCVDRAKWGSTVVGKGSKIDNLTQIAHNVQIGRCCGLASQVGVAGSTEVGDGVIMWGQVGVPDNVRIGHGSVLLAKSGIKNSVPDGEHYFGTPAIPMRQAGTQMAALTRLPTALKRLRALEKKIEALEAMSGGEA